MIDPVPDPPVAPPTRGIVLEHAAGLYDWLSPPMLFWRERHINLRAVEQLDPCSSDCVLDVGCATGRATLVVAEKLDAARGGLAIGLDAAPAMIARARRKIRNRPLRFDVGIAEKLPYPDAVFQKAISTMFFHHLNIEDKLTALREIHRVLKDGGRFVLVDVDVPTNGFGRLCARSGQWLFNQPEIAENIDGKLPPLFIRAGFADARRLAVDLGYIATFVMHKTDG